MSPSPRKRPARTIPAGPKFKSDMLAKFMNVVMESGQEVRRRAHYLLAHSTASREDGPRRAEAARKVLSTALENVKPIGRGQEPARRWRHLPRCPIEVRASRRQALAMRWVIGPRRARSEKSMAHRLAHELLDAAENG